VAKLVYLAPDNQKVSQLNVVPLSGGSPIALTHEANEILEFNISPDLKTILFFHIK